MSVETFTTALGEPVVTEPGYVRLVNAGHCYGDGYHIPADRFTGKAISSEELYPEMVYSCTECSHTISGSLMAMPADPLFDDDDPFDYLGLAKMSLEQQIYAAEKAGMIRPDEVRDLLKQSKGLD